MNGRVITWLLAAIAMASPLALNLFVPAMPIAAQSLGVSIGEIQLSYSGYLLFLAGGQLISGPLADHYGRIPVLLGGLLLITLGSLIAALATELSQLVLGRVMQGFGGGATMVLSRTLMLDIFGRENASSRMGYIVMAIAIGQSIAPTAGGSLSTWYDWSLVFSVSFVYAAALLVMTITTQKSWAPQGKTVRPALNPLQQYRVLLGNPAYTGYALSSTLVAMAAVVFVGSAPFIVVNELGGTAADFGYWFLAVSGGFLLGSSLSTRITRTRGIDRMIRSGNRLSLAGALLLLGVVLAGWLNLPWLFLPMAVIAIGRGLSQPNAQTAAISAVDGSTGTAAGLTGFIQLIGSALIAQCVPPLLNQGIAPVMSLMLILIALAMTAHHMGKKYTTDATAAAS